MRKIMFDDKYGLETAVIELLKTMTRRIESANSKPYQIGEVLAIAQSYMSIYEELEEKYGNCEANDWWCDLYDRIGDPTRHAGYRNKMFVSADFMLRYIKITGAKHERLQDITDEECLAEGIMYNPKGVAKYGYRIGEGKSKWYRTPKDAFSSLIDKVSGKGTWESNPWVFAYTFELLR